MRRGALDVGAERRGRPEAGGGAGAPGEALRAGLFDRQGRRIRYLRLAVTDRCNLRCRYCMPAEGIAFAPRRELLSWPEMLRLVAELTDAGIDKLRITGGEPFVRAGLVEWLGQVARLPNAPEVSITTNATLIRPHVARLRDVGVRAVNVSLDALDAGGFFRITRRNLFDEVYANLLALVDAGLDVKVNCIVLDGQNADQLLDFVALTRKLPVDVRFLEEMPFNGSTGAGEARGITWDHRRILAHVRDAHPELRRVPTAHPGQAAVNYAVPGHAGRVGIIASYSRTFCGTCNRIRVNAKGELRTCLYGDNVASFAPALRGEDGDVSGAVRRVLAKALYERHTDGHAAEATHGRYASMTAIGG